MRPRLIRISVLAAMVPCFSVHAAEPSGTGARFVQDRFVIGLWVPPQGEDLERHYRELAEAHFNLVIGSSGIPPAQQLALCERFGLRALVRAEGPVEEYPQGPACWGYLLADEPGAKRFPELADRVEALHRARPGRLGYINLFPNYAPAGALGTATYDEHVDEFMRQVRPDVLSMDHYPLMRPDRDTRDAYCTNLETMRRHALASGVPFWNFFYCMPFGDRLDPTEAQIRWQINASLAHGAKGVLYFCYWTPGQGAAGAGEFPKGGAIVTAEGFKTRHYDEARRINAELVSLGPTLMQLTSTGVARVDTGSQPGEFPSGHALKALRSIAGDPPGAFLVGHFRHADASRAVLIVNQSYSFTAWPTVEFDADHSAVREVDKSTGELMPARDDSPELPGFQMSLGAGDARLFVIPGS